MRTSLLVAASFAFVVSSGIAARSQEADRTPKVDQTLIHDVETAPAQNAKGNPNAAGSKPKEDRGEKVHKLAPGTKYVTFNEPAAAKTNNAQDAAAALPATLDEALTKALRSNPEVLLAEATVRQAQAEYNQTKLKAVQDVTVAFQQWNALQEKRKYDQKMHEKGYVGASEIRQLSSELAETEAKLAYLMGGGAELHPADPSVRKVILTPMGTSEKIYVFSRDSGEAVAKAGAADKAAAYKGAVEKRPEIPEKYRKILQKPMKVKFTDMPLDQVIDQLNKVTGKELPFLLRSMAPFDGSSLNVELEDELPLQTVLELIADLTGCVFLFRDYGLLVAPGGRYHAAATIPEY